MLIYGSHNPYFNRWFSAIDKKTTFAHEYVVTILILIDGFLQYGFFELIVICITSHNPYFNRWFSAICLQANI